VSESGTTEPPAPEYWIGVDLRQTSPPPPPPGRIDTLAKTLAGGYVFVAFVLTTIGGLQGGLERLLINHPWWTVLGLLAAGAGIALAFVDAYVIRGKSRVLFIVVALVLFGFGLVVLIYLSTRSISQNERPTITATAAAGDGSKLEGHVTAFAVKSSEWIYLGVNGFHTPPSQEGGDSNSNETGGKPILLYQTRAGPDRSGKVDVSFNIPVSFGRFSFVRIGATRAASHGDESIDTCFVNTKVRNKEVPAKDDQSCATVYPPRGQERPTLSASWEKGSDTTNVFDVAVKATGADPGAVVLLIVTNGKGGSRGKVFYRSILSASATGVLDASSKVPVPKKEARVCVVASTISATDTTTLKAQSKARTCSVDSFDRSKASFALFPNLP
jgi:hypothetical protein